jgi:hypothetical protein
MTNVAKICDKIKQNTPLKFKTLIIYVAPDFIQDMQSANIR